MNRLAEQCAALGCVNCRSQGRFVGDYCAPCDESLRTGIALNGTSLVYTQQQLIEKLRDQLAAEGEDHAQLESRCFEGFPSASDGIFDAYKEDRQKIKRLRAVLERLSRFTFIERWAMKGLDGEAQALYELVEETLK